MSKNILRANGADGQAATRTKESSKRLTRLDHARRDPRITPLAYQVLAEIGCRFGSNGECDDAQEIIARDIHASPRGVRYAIELLVDLKYLEREYRGTNRRLGTVYRLVSSALNAHELPVSCATIAHENPVSWANDDSFHGQPLPIPSLTDSPLQKEREMKTSLFPSMERSSAESQSLSRKKGALQKGREESVEAESSGKGLTAADRESETADRAKKKIRRKPRTFLPDESEGQMVLPDEWRRFALEQQMPVDILDREFAQFCDYHRSRGNSMADWKAAWGTWCRNGFGWKNKPRQEESSIPGLRADVARVISKYREPQKVHS
jgi:hypothetical protein